MLYDVTSLPFEAEREDKLRKAGMSKEHRAGPQVTVGLLTTATGFPVEVDLFEGNKAETTTLIPVLTRFRGRHQAHDIVSWLTPGCCLRRTCWPGRTTGSGSSPAPGPARSPTSSRPTSSGTGTTWPTVRRSRPPGAWAPGRRRVTGEWPATTRSSVPSTTTRRSTPLAGRAEKVASGERPLKKDRFVTLTDTSTSVNWDLVERARSLAGIKGYVTNIDPAVMDGPPVVAAYHDLCQVERSFRMTKSDLAARPVFHRLEDSIQAHLTIVFAALAVSREAQARAGLSINKVFKFLRPMRSATVTIGAQQVTAPPRIPAQARTLLNGLGWSGH